MPVKGEITKEESRIKYSGTPPGKDYWTIVSINGRYYVMPKYDSIILSLLGVKKIHTPFIYHFKINQLIEVINDRLEESGGLRVDFSAKYPVRRKLHKTSTSLENWIFYSTPYFLKTHSTSYPYVVPYCHTIITN